MTFDIALPPGTARPAEAPVTYQQIQTLLPFAKKAMKESGEEWAQRNAGSLISFQHTNGVAFGLLSNREKHANDPQLGAAMESVCKLFNKVIAAKFKVEGTFWKPTDTGPEKWTIKDSPLKFTHNERGFISASFTQYADFNFDHLLNVINYKPQEWRQTNNFAPGSRASITHMETLLGLGKRLMMTGHLPEWTKKFADVLTVTKETRKFLVYSRQEDGSWTEPPGCIVLGKSWKNIPADYNIDVALGKICDLFNQHITMKFIQRTKQNDGSFSDETFSPLYFELASGRITAWYQQCPLEIDKYMELFINTFNKSFPQAEESKHAN